MWPRDYLEQFPIYKLMKISRRLGVSRAQFKRLREDLLAYNTDMWERRKDCYGKQVKTASVKVPCTILFRGPPCAPGYSGTQFATSHIEAVWCIREEVQFTRDKVLSWDGLPARTPCDLIISV